MKHLAYFAAAAVAVLAGCSSGSDSTATPTGTATGSPTTAATGTATAGPGALTPTSGDASFVAVIDLATGQATARFESDEIWNAWFEPGGEVVNALVLAEGQQPRTVRLTLDGGVLDDSAEALQVRLNVDETARAFGGPVNEAFFQMFLEVDGELVELAGDPTVLPVAFSPQGDQLLSYLGIPPTVEGEAAISYTVHSLDGSVATVFVNRLSVTDAAGSQATWSPSGQYVATAGLDGLSVHDVESGETITLGEKGWTEWSPAEDALLVIAGPSELQVVSLPDRDIVSIEVNTSGIAASFDPSGQVVTVSNAARRTTTVFDATTGEELLALSGAAEGVNITGFEPGDHDGRRPRGCDREFRRLRWGARHPSVARGTWAVSDREQPTLGARRERRRVYAWLGGRGLRHRSAERAGCRAACTGRERRYAGALE